GSPHCLDHVLTDYGIPGQIHQGHFEVTYHHSEMIVEKVCDSSGHTAKAFSLLQLPVLGFESRSFRLRVFQFGDVLAEDYYACDVTRLIAPRPHFPTEPLDTTVCSLEAVVVGPHHLTRQSSAVDCLPTFGNLRKDFVVQIGRAH